MSKPLKILIEQIIPEEHQWKFELFKQWPSIIGPLKKHISIEKIDNSTLFLNVTHAAWAQEMHLLAPVIQNKINALFNEPKITSIRLKQRRPIIQQPNITQNQHQQIKNSPEETMEISQLSIQESSILAPIANAELQSSVAAYFTQCKRVQRNMYEKNLHAKSFVNYNNQSLYNSSKK